MPQPDTKTRILDAAEELFARKGFSAVSIREIIRKAQVNTASVHYHFGSRRGLIAAVLARRAAPMNEERIRLLDQLEAAYPSGRVPLEKLIEAFVGPTVRLHYERGRKRSLFPLLMVRALVETDFDVHRKVAESFGEVFQRFSRAFSRALPDLPASEVAWRIHFMIGALAFTIGVPGITARTGGAAGRRPKPPGYPSLKVGRGESVDRVVQRLVSFVSAGMRAAYRRSLVPR